MTLSYTSLIGSNEPKDSQTVLMRLFTASSDTGATFQYNTAKTREKASILYGPKGKENIFDINKLHNEDILVKESIANSLSNECNHLERNPLAGINSNQKTGDRSSPLFDMIAQTQKSYSSNTTTATFNGFLPQTTVVESYTHLDSTIDSSAAKLPANNPMGNYKSRQDQISNQCVEKQRQINGVIGARSVKKKSLLSDSIQHEMFPKYDSDTFSNFRKHTNDETARKLAETKVLSNLSDNTSKSYVNYSKTKTQLQKQMGNFKNKSRSISPQQSQGCGVKTGVFYSNRDSDTGICEFKEIEVEDRSEGTVIGESSCPSYVRRSASNSFTPNDSGNLLICAAYTEPLSPESLFCGNVVKARYKDGKLYRGEIIKVDGKRRRCLIDFIQHPETWCSADDIFPSSPVKSQVIKRLKEKARSRGPSPLAQEPAKSHAGDRHDVRPVKQTNLFTKIDDVVTLDMEVDESEPSEKSDRSENSSSVGDDDSNTHDVYDDDPMSVDDVTSVAYESSVSGESMKTTEDDATSINDEHDDETSSNDVISVNDQESSFTDPDMYCEVCLGGESVSPNEIVICDKCGKGFHQMCHKPNIADWVIENESAEWLCNSCFSKYGGRSCRKKTSAQEFRPTSPFRGKLPKKTSELCYDPRKLTWNTAHVENEEKRYCYCGQDGKWFLQMLQCHGCKQWYHQECIQCLRMPLMYGDRFYAYLCSVCNGGREFIFRLHLRWVDFVHLAAFHLGMLLGKPSLDFHDDLMPFLDENYDSLQLPKEIHEYDAGQIHYKIEGILKDECRTGRFKVHKKGTKRLATYYGLSVRCPPEAPLINLPTYRPLTDGNTVCWAWKHSFRKFVVANQVAVDWPYSRPALGTELSLGTLLVPTSGKRKASLGSPQKLPPTKKRKTDKSPVTRAPSRKQKKERIFVKGNSHKTVRVTSYPPAKRFPVYSPPKTPRPGGSPKKAPPSPEKPAETAVKSPVPKPVFRPYENTLERLIPTPKDFTGIRNPFLFEVERSEMLAASQWKQYAVHVCTKGSIVLTTEENPCIIKPAPDGSDSKTKQQNSSKTDGVKGKGKRKKEKEAKFEPKLPEGMPAFKYEPFIVTGKRTRGEKTEYMFTWDKIL